MAAVVANNGNGNNNVVGDPTADMFRAMPRETVRFFQVLMGVGTATSLGSLIYSLPCIYTQWWQVKQATYIQCALYYWLSAMCAIQLLQVSLRARLINRLAINPARIPRRRIIREMEALLQSIEWRVNKYAGNAAYWFFITGSCLTSIQRTWAEEEASTDHIMPTVMVTLVAMAARLAFSFAWFFYNFVYGNDMPNVIGRNGRAADDAMLRQHLSVFTWPASGDSMPTTFAREEIGGAAAASFSSSDTESDAPAAANNPTPVAAAPAAAGAGAETAVVAPTAGKVAPIVLGDDENLVGGPQSPAPVGFMRRSGGASAMPSPCCGSKHTGVSCEAAANVSLPTLDAALPDAKTCTHDSSSSTAADAASCDASATPAGQSAPAALPTSCAVCLADFEAGEVIAQLPCSTLHIFHKACVVPWLRVQKRCPLCTIDIDEPRDAEGPPSGKAKTE